MIRNWSGDPHSIVSEQGSHFTAKKEESQWAYACGIYWSYHESYHPGKARQKNGRIAFGRSNYGRSWETTAFPLWRAILQGVPYAWSKRAINIWCYPSHNQISWVQNQGESSPTVSPNEWRSHTIFAPHTYQMPLWPLLFPWPTVKLSCNNRKCWELMPQEFWINPLVSSHPSGIIWGACHCPSTSIQWDLSFVSDLKSLPAFWNYM